MSEPQQPQPEQPQPEPTRPATPLTEAAGSIRRPRYRPQCPLLWRGPGRLQIGEGTFHVLLGDVDPAMVTWLLGLDGLRTLDQVVATLPIPAIDATRLLRAAVHAVAIEDAASIPDSWRWTSVEERDATGPDRQAAASTYGSMARADLAIDRRAAFRWWVRGRGLLAEQAALALTTAGLAQARTAATADVLILADTRHPVAFTEPELSLPHLPIGAYGDRALVGPLVIPGRTSCIQCALLHTRDADPCWPLVSLQLEHSIDRLVDRPTDRLHALMAAAAAAALIRGWVDQPENPAWVNRAIEIRLPDGQRIEHERPRHPMCSCTWDLRASAGTRFG